MKILYICINDWSNFAYEQCEALRSVGADANCYKLNAHEFNYENQAQIVTMEKMKELIKQADFVNFAHGEIRLLHQLINHLNGKKVAVTHTGSAYRNAPEQHNANFNPCVHFTFTDQCEFMGLGAKNIHYIAASVKPKEVNKFGHELRKPFKIGHFPSNSHVKGTVKIMEMIQKVSIPYQLLHSTELVAHKMQFQRMNDCDIYIELFKNELNGKVYGHFGVTAFEAAAAGKIVVTQNLNQVYYTSTYGSCPFILSHTEENFISNLERILQLSVKEISILQTETYEWVVANHSYEATGKRILNIIS